MATANGAEAGGLSLAITREIVGVMKDYLGRGPRHARTYLLRNNLVVCVMEGTMTKAELKLAGSHGANAVRDVRRRFHDGVRARTEGPVERLTGRHVVSFMSDHDVDADIVSVAFVLAPQNGDGALRV